MGTPQVASCKVFGCIGKEERLQPKTGIVTLRPKELLVMDK